MELQQALITASGALIVAVIGAIWTVGGRAALQRRAMRQELELAEALPAGLAKRALVRKVENQALAYAGKRLPPAGRRWVAARAIVGVLAFASWLTIGSITTDLSRQSPVPGLYFYLVDRLPVLAVAWLLLFTWVVLDVRKILAAERQEEARARLTPLDCSTDPRLSQIRDHTARACPQIVRKNFKTTHREPTVESVKPQARGHEPT
jgi:hypothetical protein